MPDFIDFNWNRVDAALGRVFIVMASCLAVRGPSGEIIPLDRITVVMASCLTLFVPSGNTTAELSTLISWSWAVS